MTYNNTNSQRTFTGTEKADTGNTEPRNHNLTSTANPRQLGKKRDVAWVLNVSPRSVDNYIAQGCPHIKSSARSCRFDLDEVKQWFKDKYGQRRLK